MKAILSFLILVSAAGLLAGAEPDSLEVHEWGTFTEVSGSDGVPLRWWQARPPSAGGLPSFVGSLGPQKAMSWMMRMETPVLFFYPNAPMQVEVTAEMRSGRITEWFPFPAAAANPSDGSLLPEYQSHRVTWKGRLVPPSDAAALSALPKVTGTEGEAYAQARDVPDAWFIQSPEPAQTEKFVFYRGASNMLPPWQAKVNPDLEVELASTGATVAPHAAFVVETRAGVTRWGRLQRSGLGFAGMEVEHPGANAQKIGQAMVETLAAAGLTQAEAQAMVATWSGHWFSETGTRVLVLLPQSWVDQVLPLTVSPAPRKTVRVFAARFEVLTPERENALLTMLDDPKAGPASYADLQLGRFGPAALLRAERMVTQRVYRRFAELSAPAASDSR